jgi:N-acetylglutamate synthase-like GNAT family acetyltransferase
VRAEPAIRDARPEDMDAIRTLLSAAKLPLAGVPEDTALLLVAEQDGRVVGVAGLELHAGDALVRSVAVESAHRGRRLASRLCSELESRAAGLGAGRAFLLTETAETFFARRGYTRLDRARAPGGIAASREFAAVCPASAILMFRGL